MKIPIQTRVAFTVQMEALVELQHYNRKVMKHFKYTAEVIRHILRNFHRKQHSKYLISVLALHLSHRFDESKSHNGKIAVEIFK